MFKVLRTGGRARRGEFSCAHGGVVQTPVFMNVGTQGAIKGGVSAHDLKEVGCQIELSNPYHQHLRPGDHIVRQMGGLHKFMDWDGPILTDSGGFQVFSLSGLRTIKEEGVTFASHIDGRRIFMGPEESMQIQSNLGSDIAMAFDECVENPATYEYAKASCERTLRWLARCKAEHDRVGQDRAVPPHEPVQAAHLPHHLVAGAQVKVVGVGQLYLTADLLQIVGRHRTLDGPLGAHVHEHRRLHRAVGAGKDTPAGLSLCFQDFKHVKTPLSKTYLS